MRRAVFLDTEEVRGSNPLAPTTKDPGHRAFTSEPFAARDVRRRPQDSAQPRGSLLGAEAMGSRMERSLRIKQYVYFAIKSKAMSAAGMARAIGFEPDRVLTRGSKREEPPTPRTHAWQLVCD